MAKPIVKPTGLERRFDEDELIVSKTDPQGRITYANALFVQISGYTRHELIGSAHSLVRHPDMPRGVFKLLWDTIQDGQEVFAYVKNLAKNGDHYWVFAHVTPTFDEAGRIVSYHSNRRTPDRSALAAIEPIYAAMLREESRHARASAAEASIQILTEELSARATTYGELMFSLEAAS
jgi:PAS domain S-box-containing protein